MITVTLSKFARLVNVNRSNITRAVQRGRLVATEDGIALDADTQDADGLELAALALWEASGSGQPHHRARMQQIRDEKVARKAMASVAENSDEPDAMRLAKETITDLNLRLKRAETEKREHEAEKARIEREAMAKTYLLREAVEFALRDYTAKVREQMDNLADRLAPRVHALESVEEVRAVLAEAADIVLREVAASSTLAMKVAMEDAE